MRLNSIVEKLILILLFAFVVVLTSANETITFGIGSTSGSGAKPTQSASLSATAVTIPLGDSVEVSIKNPGNKDTYTWLAAGSTYSGSGSAGGKVTVSKYGISNRIYGAAKGTAIVYVYKNGKYFGKIDCTISEATDPNNIPIVDIVINDRIYIKKKGITVSATRKILPIGAKEKDLSWASSDHSIAMVSGNGSITGKGNGVCTVTVSNKTGTVKKYVTVTVGNGALTNPTLDKTSIVDGPIGGAEAIQILDLGGLIVKDWISTNTNVIYVTQGNNSSQCVCNFVGAGEASVICELSNGKVLSCKVTVAGGGTDGGDDGETTIERVQLPNGEVRYSKIKLAKKVGYEYDVTDKNKKNSAIVSRTDESSKVIIIGFGGDGQRTVTKNDKNIVVNDDRISNNYNYIYFGSSAFTSSGKSNDTKRATSVDRATDFVSEIIGDGDPSEYTIIVYGYSRGGDAIDATYESLVAAGMQPDYVVMADACVEVGKQKYNQRQEYWEENVEKYQSSGSDVVILTPKKSHGDCTKVGNHIGDQILSGENEALSGATYQVICSENGRAADHGLVGQYSANVVYEIASGSEPSQGE